MSDEADGSEEDADAPDPLSMDEVEERLDEIEELQEEADEGERMEAPDRSSGAEPVAPPGDGVDLGGGDFEDATEAGRPNVARGPEAPGPQGEPVEAYVGAIELFARLPEDVRLPDEAEDVVPVVVEASLRRRITEYVALEFDADEPQVSRIGFEEVEGEGVWMKMRLGAEADALEDLAGNLDGLRRAALEQLEALMDAGGPD